MAKIKFLLKQIGFIIAIIALAMVLNNSFNPIEWSGVSKVFTSIIVIGISIYTIMEFNYQDEQQVK